MLFLLIDLCATITLLAGIEPDHWFGLKLKKVAGSILKIGAIDGTRTHLIRIDNPLPSPRTTMAKLGGDYWDRTSRARRRRIYNPLHHHWCFISIFLFPVGTAPTIYCEHLHSLVNSLPTGFALGFWREILVEHSGIEPLLVDWKPTVLTDRRMLHYM